MTMHRPANVDDPDRLAELARTVSGVAGDLLVVFPIHPRTRARLNGLGVVSIRGVSLIEPLGYIDFLGLMNESALVLTDSGGIQEETSVLGVPCLTLRPNTERPITCTLGTNQVVGTEPDAIQQAVQDTLSRTWHPATIPLWDGHTAQRIAAVLTNDLA
jgi:UDP-N-acetylglucosamine 2-epimerase (non-hydrolysing)